MSKLVIFQERLLVDIGYVGTKKNLKRLCKSNKLKNKQTLSLRKEVVIFTVKIVLMHNIC